MKNQEVFQTSEYQYKSSIQLLENEKRDLNILCTKRGKENDRLTEEIKDLNNKVTTANNDKCEAQAKVNELMSEDVTRQYNEKKLEKEKEQLEKQIEWFDSQLTEKTNQLSSIRKEKNNHVLEIQMSLEEKTSELEHLQIMVASLKETIESQNNKIENLNEKLRDERDNQVTNDEQWRQELHAQKRLTELYQTASEDNDSKITELTGAVEELRKLLKDAAAAYTELENNREEELNKLNVLLNEKEESVEKLDTELKNANELMVQLKKGS